MKLKLIWDGLETGGAGQMATTENLRRRELTAFLGGHYSALWRRLSEYGEKIIELPESMDASVPCVGCFNSHLDTVEIASGHFATAAYYRLILDCDFYFDDDFGHDDLGKPYWSW